MIIINTSSNINVKVKLEDNNITATIDKDGYSEDENTVAAGKAAIAAALNKKIAADKTDSFSTLAKKVEKCIDTEVSESYTRFISIPNVVDKAKSNYTQIVVAEVIH